MVKSADLPMAIQSAQALLEASSKSSANRSIFQLLAIQDGLIYLVYEGGARRLPRAYPVSNRGPTSKYRRYTDI